MEISFTGKYSSNPDNFGINFEAIVDDISVICNVFKDALEDIDPEGRCNSSEQQFEKHRSSFQRIAEKKIRSGNSTPIYIRSNDLNS
jgi:hypothetical protein